LFSYHSSTLVHHRNDGLLFHHHADGLTLLSPVNTIVPIQWTDLLEALATLIACVHHTSVVKIILYDRIFHLISFFRGTSLYSFWTRHGSSISLPRLIACCGCWTGMKTVRIFSDRIRNRIRLEGF
jgi:hypothetical protein